jgi:single-strand DNA-binding protein
MQALNRVQLIGVLPRNPEMRYMPSGTAVTTFTVLTYRGWADDSGIEQESPEYTNIVTWSKLAEICNQLLVAGSKVFVEGRLQTRSWEDQEGVKHYKTELVADDMVLLGGRAGSGNVPAESDIKIGAKECLNRVQIIGNVAREPELRFLPSGTAVTTFVVATNRVWTNSEGTRQESTEFHNIVCWNSMAESVSKDVKKSQKVFVEGRLQNRSWQGDDGVKRYKTETVGSLIVGSTVRDEMSHGSEASLPGAGPADMPYVSPADYGAETINSGNPVADAANNNNSSSGDSSAATDNSNKDDEIPF